MSKAEDYRAAAQRAKAARQRFLHDLADTRSRFEPDRLKADISQAASRQAEIVKMKAKETAANHPVAVTAIAVGLGAWLFRRPLAALSRLLGVKTANMWRAHRDTQENRRQDNDDQGPQERCEDRAGVDRDAHDAGEKDD